MKFKLDENLGPSVQEIFLRRGQDLRTVQEEGLGGSHDEQVLRAATDEQRILVTLDHDFGDVLCFPPERTAGVVVLDPWGRQSRSMLRLLAEAFLIELERKTIRGKLWIVEPSRIREHESEKPMDSGIP